MLDKNSTFTFISDVVTEILFSGMSKFANFQYAKLDHHIINDFTGGLINIPDEHHVVLHFSPFFITDRKDLSELEKITSDICSLLKSRLQKSKSKIYVNTLRAQINFISKKD